MNKLTNILAGVLLTAVTILPLSGCSSSYNEVPRHHIMPQRNVLVVPRPDYRGNNRRVMTHEQIGPHDRVIIPHRGGRNISEDRDRDRGHDRKRPDYDGRRDLPRGRSDYKPGVENRAFEPGFPKIDAPKYSPRIERPDYKPGRDRGEVRTERPNYNGRNESDGQRQSDLRQRRSQSYEGKSFNRPEHKKSPAK